MKVAVYWNLHKACWSIQSREGGNRGRVIAHASWVRLEGCEFKVSEAGRQRVLAEKRKNVHAFVVGRLVAYDDPDGTYIEVAGFTSKREDRQRMVVTYNPYRGPSFFDKETGESVQAAELVFMGAKVVIAYR